MVEIKEEKKAVKEKVKNPNIIEETTILGRIMETEKDRQDRIDQEHRRALERNIIKMRKNADDYKTFLKAYLVAHLTRIN